MRAITLTFMMLSLFSQIGIEPAHAQTSTSWNGRSSGGPVFRSIRDRSRRRDDVSLRRTGLSAFSLQFRGDAKKLGALSTGFFDFYGNRTTPVVQALLSRDSGRQSFNWGVTRQELPRQSFCHACVLKVRGSVAKGVGTKRIPLILYPGSGYAILQGFRFQVVGKPRKISHFAVEIVESRYYPRFHLEVQLEGGEDFAFFYEVQITTAMDAVVRDQGDVTFLGRGSGSSKYRQNETLQNPALQGFNFRFSRGSHKLDRVGVELGPNDVSTWFADGGYDDLYHATVHWIDFPNP